MKRNFGSDIYLDICVRKVLDILEKYAIIIITVTITNIEKEKTI